MPWRDNRALVAQRIEQRSSEPLMEVQFLPGAQKGNHAPIVQWIE